MLHEAVDVRRRGARRQIDIGSLPYASLVAPGIFLLKPHEWGFSYENALFIEDEVNVLIDTGLTYEQVLEIRDAVDVVVNSHCHLGHSGKDYLFQEIWAHRAEASALEDFERLLAYVGVKGRSWESQMRRYFRDAGCDGPIMVARRFDGGDTLVFGRTRWQVVAAPGHTRTHCCFYEANLKVLYAADVTLNSFGPHYATPGADLAAFRSTVERLQTLPLRAVATSSKGPIFDDFHGHFKRFAEVFDRRDAKLLALLQMPRTLEDLVQELPIFGSFGSKQEWEEMLFDSERKMIKQHLRQLLTSGQIFREGERFRAFDLP